MAKLLLTIVLISIILVTGVEYDANATCVTSPRGSTICAGMDQTINIAKSNSSSFTYTENPQVMITLNCAINDIHYGDYLNSCYQPSVLHVGVGTTVTWKNDDIWQHTITYGNPFGELSQGYFFDSKAIEQGESFSYNFKYPGAYPYYDDFNWWETGVVIVSK